MTKIALIADAHVANHKRWGGPMTGGLNVRGHECVETLRTAVKLARREMCETLVVMGDLFDGTRPSPSLVYETMTALTSEPTVRIVIILGNHDRQSQHAVDHACASAALVPRVTVVNEPWVIRSALDDVSMLCVPYQPGPAIDWLTTGLAELAPKYAGRGRGIVLTHLGIWDDSTPAFLKSTHDSIGIGHVNWLLDAHKLDALYAGNWHEPNQWGPRNTSSRLTDGPDVAIPGSICRHNFSDPSGFGTMLVYDSGINCSYPVLVPGPQFVTLHGLDAFRSFSSTCLAQWGSNAVRSRVYMRAVVGRSELEDAMALRDGLDPARCVVQVDVLDGDARESVREAARAAVASGDDLTGFADLAAVQAPGTSAGVERRLIEYRKGAG